MTAPCPACGRTLPPTPARCECGHAASAHEMNRAGRRTWCSHYDRSGPCGCRVFTSVPATAGRAQPEE